MATSPFREILKELDSQNIEYVPTKKGWLIKSPDGKGLVTIHGTPSDHRALKNAVADLRRICGYVPKSR